MADIPSAAPATAHAGASAEERTLVIERLLPASPERVFDAWTDPPQLVKWWGPEGFSVPESAIDVRPGGHWTTTMVGPDGFRGQVSGVYRELVRPRRLVFTWGWHDSSGARPTETEVAVTLEPAGRGTKLQLVQRIFQTVEERLSHTGGWESSLNDLERWLTEAA